MKKIAFILGAAFLLATTTINAQTDTLPKEPAKVQTTTDSSMTMPSTTTTTNTDRWNNYSPDKYKMLPMPAPLTKEQIFPVIGHYTVTPKDVTTTETTANTTATTDNSNTNANTSTNTASSNVTITLDETNKGIAWIEGLPQGKIKAYLRKSPATYKIPAQKTEDNKDLPEGVLIYDKDANTLDICIGCKYNNDDPSSSLTMTQQPVTEEQPAVTTKAKSKKGKAKAKPKVNVVKTWRYSGSKTTESTASIAPAQ